MPQPDETESATAAWLDNASTKREIEIIAQRYPEFTRWNCVMLALQIEILAGLNIYGVYEGPDEVEEEEDETDEPWQRK